MVTILGGNLQMKGPVITIDGPAAVGKGTVARALAAQLGFAHLDSGRMYRCVGRAALAAGVDLANEAAVLDAAQPLLADPALFASQLAEADLNDEHIGAAASAVAVLPGVRAALLKPQRRWDTGAGLVADGRDMGTIIFPDAILKVFLVASLAQREQRLRQRVAVDGDDSKIQSSLDAFRQRDTRDLGREIAQVVPAADAVVCATDDLSVVQTVAQVVELYRLKQAKTQVRD